MPLKRAIKENWSQERWNAAMVRVQVDAKLTHARWTACRLANSMIFRRVYEIGKFEMAQLVLYLAHPVLVEYAAKECKKILEARKSKRDTSPYDPGQGYMHLYRIKLKEEERNA